MKIEKSDPAWIVSHEFGGTTDRLARLENELCSMREELHASALEAAYDLDDSVRSFLDALDSMLDHFDDNAPGVLLKARFNVVEADLLLLEQGVPTDMVGRVQELNQQLVIELRALLNYAIKRAGACTQ